MKTNQTTRKRLTGGILAVILLTICLVVTTYALVCYTVYVPNNIFHTGKVDIDLNGGAPIIDVEAADYDSEKPGLSRLFEPGMRVVKPFYIENKTPWDSYCRLYFSEVKGSLATVLNITVKDAKGNILYNDTMAELSKRDKVDTFVLSANSRSNYTMEFWIPPSVGNGAQGGTLTFTLCADATQMKNNGSDSKGEDKSVKFNDYGERNHFDDNTHEDKHIEEKGTSTP